MSCMKTHNKCNLKNDVYLFRYDNMKFWNLSRIVGNSQFYISLLQLLSYFEQLKNTDEGLQLSSDTIARDVYG